MKITISACFLAALLVASTACGGGGRSGSQTFRGGGLSFTYPTEWRVRTAGPVDDNVARYQVKVGPRRRANDVVAVTVGTTGVVIEGKDLAITEENIDENKDIAVMGAETMAAMGGGKLGKPTRVTVGGLPGFRAEVSHVKVWKDGRVNSHYTSVFKGPTAYTVSCVYTPEGAAEVTRACDQVLGSFRVAGVATGGWPQEKINSADQRRAHAIVLRPSDMPGASWKTGPPNTPRKLARCPYYHPDWSDLTATAVVDGHTFSRGEAEVQSHVLIFRSVAQAQAAYDSVRPDYARCAGDTFRKGLRQLKGVSIMSVRSGRLRLPRLSERTDAFRIVVVYREGGVRKPSIFADAVFLKGERAIARVTFLSNRRPLKSALERALVTKVGARIRG